MALLPHGVVNSLQRWFSVVGSGPAIVKVLGTYKEEEEISCVLGLSPWLLLLRECAWRVTAATQHAWQSSVGL